MVMAASGVLGLAALLTSASFADRTEPGEAFYWSTHGGAELDLMLVRGGRRWGFEIKYSDAPRTTKSLRVAMGDLKLERIFVIYPGEKVYDLDENIQVMPLSTVQSIRKGI